MPTHRRRESFGERSDLGASRQGFGTHLSECSLGEREATTEFGMLAAGVSARRVWFAGHQAPKLSPAARLAEELAGCWLVCRSVTVRLDL